MSDIIRIPHHLLPHDGRFGSGPSKIRYEQVEALMQGAHTLLGTSHRQTPVKHLVSSITEGLRVLFNLPSDYTIALGNGGASSFWDIACACLIDHQGAFGSYGSFSAKFAQAAANAPFLAEPIVSQSQPGTYCLPAFSEKVDTYAWTHNETSTGVCAPVKRIAGSREQGALLLIDATSAAGALPVDITETDAYYFSPQKAFSSDGGLWIAILSPHAVERAERIESASQHAGNTRWIPSLLSLGQALHNAQSNQTLNTPAIATLIMLENQIRWLNDQGGLDWAVARSEQSARILYTWAEQSTYIQPFVRDPQSRSHAVVTLDLDDAIEATTIARQLRDNGIVDTLGYRKLGRNQLRIGVFPSVEPDDVQALTQCIDYIVQH